ncbi:MAG: hypothetical protein ACM3IG_06770, partial [Myxococcales bacterium]
ALRLAVEQRERGNEAYARRLLAEIHGERGDVEALTTERGYVDTLALAAELDMRPLVARCHAGLGLWLQRAERRDEAQDHLDMAVAMFRGMAMRFWVDKLESDRREVVLNRGKETEARLLHEASI